MKNESKNMFEILGYSRDYYVGLKYIGSERLETPDRDTFSYNGRVSYVLTEDMVFKGKKRINKGTLVTTEVIPLCGKRIKK